MRTNETSIPWTRPPHPVREVSKDRDDLGAKAMVQGDGTVIRDVKGKGGETILRAFNLKDVEDGGMVGW